MCQTPETSTPYNNSENLATLGSGWQFMRYLLDNTTGDQAAFSRAIDNGVVSGFANVSSVFSLPPAALAAAYQSWAIAQYVDGTGLSSNAAYSNPSWNFRDVIAKAFGLGTFPLKIRPLLCRQHRYRSFCAADRASYIRFRVNAGSTAQITPTNGVVASTNVGYWLVRTF